MSFSGFCLTRTALAAWLSQGLSRTGPPPLHELVRQSYGPARLSTSFKSYLYRCIISLGVLAALNSWVVPSQPMAAYQPRQCADADPILFGQLWSKTGPSPIVGQELVDLLGREAVNQMALRCRVDARSLLRCRELPVAFSGIGASAQVGGRAPVQLLPAEAHQIYRAQLPGAGPARNSSGEYQPSERRGARFWPLRPCLRLDDLHGDAASFGARERPAHVRAGRGR